MKNKVLVLENFIKGLPRLIPELKIIKINKEKPKVGPYDLCIQIKIGTISRKLVCEVKSQGEPRFIHQAVSRLTLSIKKEAKNVYPIVITSYISKEGQDICKRANVGFIDLQGNVYLKFDNVLIEKVIDKKIPAEKKTIKKIFSPISSRIIRVLLENHDEIWTLQKLSNEAEASLRQVFLVINELVNKEYIIKERGAIRLVKPGELLNLWAQNYNFNSNKIFGFYSFARTLDEFLTAIRKTTDNTNLAYGLTLHCGASLIAPYIRFSSNHMYVDGDIHIWIDKLNLKPTETGANTYLITPYDKGIFYNRQIIDKVAIVCNTQLYLDLVNYPARGREQADFLRKEKMDF